MIEINQRIYFEQNDNYKRAHRFYSLYNKIRCVHTYYKNKDREREKKGESAQQIRLFKGDK